MTNFPRENVVKTTTYLAVPVEIKLSTMQKRQIEVMLIDKT